MTDLTSTNNLPSMTQEDIMIEILRGQKETKERMNVVEKRLDVIENTSPIPNATSKRLTKLRLARVIKWLGGKDSRAYKSVEIDEYGTHHRFSQKVFREFAQDFYEEFDLGTYSDLQKGQVKQAEEYIREWEPSTNTKRKINQLNNQIELFTVN